MEQRNYFSGVSQTEKVRCQNTSNPDIGGIGPTDQLEVVQTSTDGPTMINETEWLILPVGYNLDDHLNVC